MKHNTTTSAPRQLADTIGHDLKNSINAPHNTNAAGGNNIKKSHMVSAKVINSPINNRLQILR